MSTIDDIIERETGGKPNGGYTNNPKDTGGETKWGISKRAFPHLDIANLTRDQAAGIYYDRYIKAPGFERVAFEPLREQLVDFGVNSGVAVATRKLQAIILVPEDGVLGDATAAAVNLLDGRLLNNHLMVARVKMLGSICVNRPSQLTFLNGWLTRALSFLLP